MSLKTAAELDSAQLDVASFKYTLASVIGAQEAELVDGLSRRSVVRRFVDLAAAQRGKTESEVEVQTGVLSALVNLACIGGVPILKEQGAVPLILKLYRSQAPSVQLYAVAAIQNTARDVECAWRYIDAGAEEVLVDIFNTTSNDKLKRYATGALANLKAMRKQPPPAALKINMKWLRKRQSASAMGAIEGVLAEAALMRWRQDRCAEILRQHAAKLIAKGLYAAQ
eukprot:2005565-Pleurochrysis_carterae.AAC.3